MWIHSCGYMPVKFVEHRKLDSEKKNERDGDGDDKKRQQWRGHKSRVYMSERAKVCKHFTHIKRFQLLIHSQFLYWLLAFFKPQPTYENMHTLHITYLPHDIIHYVIYQLRIFGIKSKIAFRLLAIIHRNRKHNWTTRAYTNTYAKMKSFSKIYLYVSLRCTI